METESRSFHTFSESLRRRLLEPLPAFTAHRILAPMERPLAPAAGVTPRESAVLVLLFPHGDKIHVLLNVRSSYEGVHSGQVSFPGGRCEESDRSPEDTAIRETNEELGIGPHVIRILGRLSEIYITPSNYRVHPVVAVTDSMPAVVPDPREVAQVFSASLDLFLHAHVQVSSIIHSSGQKIKTPCYQAEGRVIWGATAMMLSELAALYEEITSS